MKAFFVAGALLASVLVAAPLSALATVTPISGTDVGLEHDPSGIVVSKSQTSPTGVVTFLNVKPGKYLLNVNGIFDRWPPDFICPCAALVQITIPGQAKISENESSRPGDRSMKTADRRPIRFTVTGSKMQTVTVIITRGSRSK